MTQMHTRHLRVLMAVGSVSLVAVAALVIAFAAGATKSHGTPGLRDTAQLPLSVVGRRATVMRLVDGSTGTVFDTASLRGKPYMVTFLYTHCTTVCPLIGAELQTALASLGPTAKRVAVVAVSVDPKGDTAATVHTWLALHREPANFHYLIGTSAQLRPYWNAWHVAPQIVGDPDSSHSALIWLVGADGRLVSIVDAGVQVPSSDIAYDFRSLLASGG